MSYSIVSTLRWWARDTPDRLAINVDGQPLSWKQLSDRAHQIAAKLQGLGVKPGDRVAGHGLLSADYFALAVGVQLIGAVLTPLNIRFTERELGDALADTTPVLLFADEERFELSSRVVATRGGPPLTPMSELDAWRDPPARPFDFHADRDDAVCIMSTSGSTAKPKFVVFTHSMIVSIANEFQMIEPAINKHAKVLIVNPVFSGGLYLMFTYLTLGVSLFVQSWFDADAALELIEKQRINVFPATPIHWQRMAATARFAEADVSSLVWTTIAGSRVPAALLELWRDKGLILRQGFGQTEAGGAWYSTADPEHRPQQAGYGGPFTEWAIMKDGVLLAPNEVGEIVIRGPSVMAGYWHNPEATHQVLQGGWLHTGDLGVIDETGSLTFIDRMKDIIISGGMNISAAEVEHVVGEIDGVEEVAVIAAEDPKFGETPLAIIYASRPMSAAEVVEHCDRNLSNYKVPRYVVFEAEPLPRLPTLKISKPMLRERYKDAAQRLAKVR